MTKFIKSLKSTKNAQIKCEIRSDDSDNLIARIIRTHRNGTVSTTYTYPVGMTLEQITIDFTASYCN